ncbi:MAG: Crp/Fnr family transcriptional regulator [Bdellovibrionales bacterium]|nr:Crp/Fnr family transcriptional regulator [Bdellovibrionales bacterium]
MTTGTTAPVKSGLRSLKTGEVLFNDGDPAESLFIIQKGQIRLYKPKGKGFVEIGVLRSGEVIGEMAFFDDDGSGKKRSCSAAAITGVEIVEVSFLAFGKTMQSLNPWFKTIINTLATRLRKANGRVKELEDNATASYGKNSGTYEFMKPIEVMRILGTLFLVFKAHGEVKGQSLAVHRKTLTLYTADMYQIMEAKLESILNLLVTLNFMEIVDDEDKVPNLLLLKNNELIRQIFIFYNTERHLADEKKMRISDKCEMIIAKMLEKLPANPVVDIPNLKVTEEFTPKFTKYYVLNAVIDEMKAKNIPINPEHLDDGKSVGLFGEVLMKDGQVFVEADMGKVQKMYPIIRFMNAIRKSNTEKA